MIRRVYKGKANKGAMRHKHANVPQLEALMKEYNILSKGKTLSGHFSPEDAIDVLETATSRDRTVSEIVTAAVRVGLPTVKKQFPPTRE